MNEITIQEMIKRGSKSPADLALVKRIISKKYKIPCLGNIGLLKAYHKMVGLKRIEKSKIIEDLLKKRPIRSLSGIVNVSVLTKPYPCPGKCLYCPAEEGIPKSYVSGEPAVERAKKLKFNPYLQVKRRIKMLESEGHPTDKIEVRIVGGTWSYYPRKYQTWFVKRCFDACNEKSGKSLKESQRLNEKAKHRMVGLSIETRPDFIGEAEIKQLRELGVTMVELGVQSIDEIVLKLNARGHGVKEIIFATKTLKDAGFKVLYQMMPNLFGSSFKKDEKMFAELFRNPDFRPDSLKIYPCAVLKEAPLYRQWKAGKYKPYSAKILVRLIGEIKKNIPYYVRIQRITRDIPSDTVLAGPAKISNLRQIILENMKKEKQKCGCVRCREVRRNYDPEEKTFLFRQDYEASEGKEIFLSFENKNRDKLYSLLRLRIPSSLTHPFLALRNAAIIREIHTYGASVPISEIKNAPQHRGFGKILIKEAEKIAKREFRLDKMAVISGVGVRHYYRKLRYYLNGTYMVKKIK